MEPPSGQGVEAFRNAKFTVLDSIGPLRPGACVRGQYDGYRDVTGVAPDSHVETYAAFRLEVQTWRWGGVPFYVRTGLEADCFVVAERVQIALRNDGYPDARIAYTRSVEDVLARVAHWTVWRNGTSVLIPAVGGPAAHTQSFH
jgi:hypothetical protein